MSVIITSNGAEREITEEFVDDLRALLSTYGYFMSGSPEQDVVILDGNHNMVAYSQGCITATE